jgi:hypothetical protein
MRNQPGTASEAFLVVWNASTMVPVLFVTGPNGVGKTVVLREADSLLVEAGVAHATVELDEIARCWSPAVETPRTSFVYQNLAALWSSFAAAGAKRLLLAGLLEQRLEVQRLWEAVPGAVVTIVRLHAPLDVLEQRLLLREPEAPDGELDGARWWAQHFQREHPEDYLVESDQQRPREIAAELLRIAGWLT